MVIGKLITIGMNQKAEKTKCGIKLKHVISVYSNQTVRSLHSTYGVRMRQILKLY